jgi:hypothetical protein
MELSLIPTEKLDSLLSDIAEIKTILHEKNKQADLNKWLSKPDARIKLKVCQKTLDNYLLKGVLPYSRFAGKIYIKAADIEAHLQRNYISK